MEHERFHYKTMQQLLDRAGELNVCIPMTEETDILFDAVEKGRISVPNRFAIQPMEGCDAEQSGIPGELTKRRYQRFAESGAGLIWMEAVAIRPEGRAKPNQLLLNEANLDPFKRLADHIRETSLKKNGFAPKLIMQLAHSGRYSNPHGYSEPIIAYNNPLFEKNGPIDPSCIISDDDLKKLEESFALAAVAAERAGFDGADIKCCHRYLLSEFLSAYTRPGEYGGSFENRTRLLRNCVAGARASTGKDFIIASRLNVYDGFPYPYGFGVKEGCGTEVDLSEGVELVNILHTKYDMNLIDTTIGNPYVNPHVNRPYDRGNYVPDEHPLEGVARLMQCVAAIQKSQPDMMILGSGFSYPRQYAVNMAAAMVKDGGCTLAGFGRMAFAYPDFIDDLKAHGKLDEKKCCISCGECAKLLRAGKCAGCVVRDSSRYKPYADR